MLKSLIVAAPAGSGKTERLSTRYIDLLKQGVKPERILTLTFTEKAAAEMKERILKRLRESHPNLYRDIRENILRLRISTIHSFCLGLLRRFAPHVGLDPALEALDESGAAALWNRALYDTLGRIAAHPRTADYRTLMDLIARDKTQAWGKLTEQFGRLYAKRVAVERASLAPFDEARFEALARTLRTDPIGRAWFPQYEDIFPARAGASALAAAAEAMARHETHFLTDSGKTPRKNKLTPEQRDLAIRLAEYRGLLLTRYWYAEFGRMLDLFRRRFLACYDDHKREAGTVDFVDMEHRALKVISEDDEWQNILYAFDEQTDHLLVDEFQDTSFLQWAIIDKLTEEWRAGLGAKSDRGIEPTIFIVGDVKQSIYLFRDAKVEVFSVARNELRAALGDRFEERHIKRNYRSLQAIIDFANTLFSRLMGPIDQPPAPAWRTPYEPFERGRKNDASGRVEILLDHCEGRMEERRRAEAEMLCRRIQSLVADPDRPFPVYDRRPDGQEELRPCGYGDVAILLRNRTHLHVLTNALNRHGIPFIAVGGAGFYSEPEVCHLKSLLSFLVDPADSYALYALLRGPLFSLPERDLLLANSEPGRFLWDRVQSCAQKRSVLASAVAALGTWLGRVNHQTLAATLERALSERQAWKVFWEPQRVANIRKFLHIVEAMELEGRHPLRILEFLESHPDEKRADVSVETSKALQIMTVHGAKGLQFPVVFYAECDKPLGSRATSPLLIEERGPKEAWVSYIREPDVRKQNGFHAEFAEKDAEEEKRVFYVACTRATDALFLSGIWCKRRSGSTLSWLEEHLGLTEAGGRFRLAAEMPGVLCLTARDIHPITPVPAAEKQPRPPALTAPLAPTPAATVRAIARNLPSDFQRHGEGAIGLGEHIHRVLELVSLGEIDPDDLARPIQGLAFLSPNQIPAVLEHIEKLRADKELWSIIAPRPDAETELPVMYLDGETVYTGRIDRVIFTDDEARIYDYKTFPVKEDELPVLAREYHENQLAYYAAAMQRIHPGKKVSTFLVFTALPRLVQTPLAPA